LATLTAFSIKSVAALNFTTPAGPTVLLTTVSSDGLINLHDLAQLGGETEEIKPVASYSTDGTRLICVSIADGGAPRQQKKAAAAGAPAKTGGARFADEEESDESEEDGADMYDSDQEEEEDEMEVEFEDEEEEEEEEEEVEEEEEEEEEEE